MFLLENTERFWEMVRDRNFIGLCHQIKRVLGFRRPVPAPFLSQTDEPPYAFLKGDFFPTAPLRVLFFSHDLNLEGAPLSLFEMIVALRQKEITFPEVVSFTDGPLRNRYEAAGIPVSFFPWSSDSLSTINRLVSAVNALAELLRQKRPDVVFANTLRSFLAILAAKEAGIPSVWNPREGTPWDVFFGYLPNQVAQRAIGAITLPCRVIFVAHSSRRIWDRFDHYGTFDVIHNGIDLSCFPERCEPATKKQARASLNAKDDTVVILCVGTLSARKAQKDLVEAIALLPRAILKRVQVVFVGDDQNTYAKKLKRRCRAFSPDIREKIRFFPSTESVQHFYNAADLFVLCSREESFPRVILEAMAFGLPIIATPVNGVLEQCIEGENALFYRKGKIEDLAEKIATLVKDEPLRKKMGQRSLQRLGKLKTFEEMTDAYASVLQQASKKNNERLNKTRQ